MLKKLAKKMEEEVMDKYKVEDGKREAFRGRGAPLEWRRVRKNKKYRISMWGEDCWARTFPLFREYNLQRLQCKQEESTKEEEMKQQQRMTTMKDLIKKIRSKGRMDAESRWWVSELLAADCQKAWTHTTWEDTMQKCYRWLEEMKKRDEKEKMEEMHQHKVAQMIKSAVGSAGLLHKISKPTVWRGGAQILVNEEEEDTRLLDRCEAKRKEWAKHWQCDEETERGGKSLEQ